MKKDQIRLFSLKIFYLTYMPDISAVERKFSYKPRAVVQKHSSPVQMCFTGEDIKDKKNSKTHLSRYVTMTSVSLRWWGFFCIKFKVNIQNQSWHSEDIDICP